MSDPEERVRAWLLLQVQDPGSVATAISEEFVGFDHHGMPRGRSDYVVVRADVVSGGSYNLVVPLDARNDGVLNEIVERIRLKAGASEKVLLQVEKNNPWPPHVAHCYITADEHADGGKYSGDFAVGRNPASPGSNAWG